MDLGMEMRRGEGGEITKVRKWVLTVKQVSINMKTSKHIVDMERTREK